MKPWTKINPFGPDAYAYWISGIYKIVSYNDGEYLAYFIPDHYNNWGDQVSKPPDDAKQQGSKCWKTLQSAKDACARHAAAHRPAPKTVARAEDIRTCLIDQSKQYGAE